MYKIVLFLALLSGSLALERDYKALIEHEQDFHKDRFVAFMIQYNKQYSSDEELYKAFLVFKKNSASVIKRQIEDPTGTYGFTKFADISPEDFKSQYLHPLPPIDENDIPQQSTVSFGLLDWITGSNSQSTEDLPKNFDWREKNIVTRAKSQLSCGSCWAFSTTGMLEAQYALKYGKLLNFAEQQLVDCDTYNKGCKGGLMTEAYKYLKQHKLQTTDTYGSYVSKQNTCSADESKGVVKIKSYFQIAKDEKAIQRELYEKGPIAAGINGELLQFLNGGIVNPRMCSTEINHAILIVGYGETDQGVPYWIIKNQWGEEWGDKGYFKLQRGENRCGINSYASIAFIE